MRLVGKMLMGASLSLLGASSWLLYSKVPEREVDRVAQMVVQETAFVRTVFAEGNLEAAKATPISVPARGWSFNIAWLAPDGTTVGAGDVLVRFDEENFQRKLAEGENNRTIARTKLQSQRVSTKTAVRARRSAADMARLELEQASSVDSEDTEIFSRNELITSRIDAELSRKRVALADKARAIDSTVAHSKAELLKLEEKRATIEIEQAKSGLSSMEIRAPHAGIFVYKNPTLKVGDTLYSGQQIGELPLVDTMEAKVFVLEADARGLAPGKPAAIVVESQPGVRYQGTIKSVDTLAQRRLPEVPIQYFGVTLTLTKTDARVMKPGQRVRATITLESSQEIVVPRQAIFEQDGDLVAFRLQNGDFEAVKVQLGTGTPGRVVIREGLSTGDIIATQNPFVKESEQEGEDEAQTERETASGESTETLGSTL